MTARFYPHIFVIFCAYFTQLESTAHLAVQLVLFLCNRDVILLARLHCPWQVRIIGTTIRVQITNATTLQEEIHLFDGTHNPSR